LQKEFESLWDSEFADGTSVLSLPYSKDDRMTYKLMQEQMTLSLPVPVTLATGLSFLV